MNEIPAGFLPTFGLGFLTHLYDYLATSDKSFLLVACVDRTASGFICGSYGTGSLYKSFLIEKNWRILGPMLLRTASPVVLKKIWEVVRYPAGEATGDLPGSEILNFCVARSEQRHGLGRLLFRRLCDEYRIAGIEEIRIVTGAEQVAAQRFYEGVGAERVSSVQIHDGVDSVVFVHQIDDSEGDSA